MRAAPQDAMEREAAAAERSEEMRSAMARAADSAAYREELLRREAAEWEERCRASEARHQELAARLPESTRPLLRQIEALQLAAALGVGAVAAAWPAWKMSRIDIVAGLRQI